MSMGRGSRNINNKQLLFQGRLNKNSKEKIQEEKHFKLAKAEQEPPTEIDKQGNKIWRNSKGKLHRDNDLPAIINADGTQKWLKNGKIHRDGDQPAIVYASGKKEWYQNGELHRDNDLPAVIYSDGSKEWYQNGKCHRNGNKPAIVWASSHKEWWQNDKFIREEKQVSP